MSKKLLILTTGVLGSVALGAAFITGSYIASNVNAQNDTTQEVGNQTEVDSQENISEQRRFGFGPGGQKGHRGLLLDVPELSETIEYLGLDADGMREIHQSGKTLEQYIQENNLDLEKAKSLAKSEITANLDSLKEAEMITSEEYDLKLENLDEILDKMFTMSRDEIRGEMRGRVRSEMKNRMMHGFGE